MLGQVTEHSYRQNKKKIVGGDRDTENAWEFYFSLVL